MSSLRPTLSPSDTGSVRQSPFRRQNSHSPAPNLQRAPTPTSSPTKTTHLSPTKPSSLSPEKASPFVRRPSQLGGGHAAERPVSPFARPTSGLGVPASPGFRGAAAARTASVQSGSDESAEVVTLPPTSPKTRFTPAEAEKENIEEPLSPTPESQSPFDGTHLHGPPDSPKAAPLPSQANLRPTSHRIPTSSTVSTIRQPSFTPAARAATHTPAPAPALRSLASRPSKSNPYSSLPPSLLHNLRESFEVLDPNATGTLTSTSLPPVLDQLGLPHTSSSLKDFFPASGPAQLNLATYLDTLSAPLTQLSHPDELMAAFGAFDTDDSGQIDVAELREALLGTAPEPGEEDFRLSGREADAVISDFVGRRAFGARGLGAGKAGNKGEVFRYRDFMASLGGGGGNEGAGEQAMTA